MEKIEELRFEESSIVKSFAKEDTAGMLDVKGDISETEAGVRRMNKQETVIKEKIDKTKVEFDGLKKQAADLDLYDLTEARLSIRPKMESEAGERIRKALGGKQPGFWDYHISIQDTDRMLGEARMPEWFNTRQRTKAYEVGQDRSINNTRTRDLER